FIIYFFTGASVIVAVVLFSVMLTHPGLFCPLCSILHVINITLFFTINMANEFSFRNILPAFKNLKSIIFSRKIISSEKLLELFGFMTILLLIVPMYFGMKILSNKAKNDVGFIDAGSIQKEFYDQPVQQISVSADNPKLGPEKSAIQ